MNELISQMDDALKTILSKIPIRTGPRCPTTVNLLCIRLRSLLNKIQLFKEGKYEETMNCLGILVYTIEDLGQEFEHLKPKLEILKVLILSDYEDLVTAENIIKEVLFSLA
jgi:hypothetical protein